MVYNNRSVGDNNISIGQKKYKFSFKYVPCLCNLLSYLMFSNIKDKNAAATLYVC